MCDHPTVDDFVFLRGNAFRVRQRIMNFQAADDLRIVDRSRTNILRLDDLLRILESMSVTTRTYSKEPRTNKCEIKPSGLFRCHGYVMLQDINLRHVTVRGYGTFLMLFHDHSSKMQQVVADILCPRGQLALDVT